MNDLGVRFEIEYFGGKKATKTLENVKAITMYAENGDQLCVASPDDEGCLMTHFFNGYEPEIGISEVKTIQELQYKLLDTLAMVTYDSLKERNLECSIYDEPKSFVRYKCNECGTGFVSDKEHGDNECPYCCETEDFTDITKGPFAMRDLIIED